MMKFLFTSGNYKFLCGGMMFSNCSHCGPPTPVLSVTFWCPIDIFCSVID